MHTMKGLRLLGSFSTCRESDLAVKPYGSGGFGVQGSGQAFRSAKSNHAEHFIYLFTLVSLCQDAPPSPSPSPSSGSLFFCSA